MNKKIAIMQPYLFPYIGYFQLINAVDKFIIFDDVNYIKKGWINRNRVLVNNKPNLFIVPLKKLSQKKLIKDIEISKNCDWKSKFLKTIAHSYKKAPYFKETFEITENVILSDENKISKLILKSLYIIKKYLNIETIIIESSSIYNNCELKNQERIIDICKMENSDNYINPIGGIDLYSKEIFKDNNIKLSFIKPKDIYYKQFNNNFVNSLSIIDVLMFNSKDQTKKYLNEYELIW